MGRAYMCGLRVALRCWPVVLVLFVVSVGSGLCFLAAGWSWLSLALGNSLATRTLLTDLNVQVFIDLFVHHRESLHMLLLAGVVLAVVFVLLGVWLNAVVIAAVAEETSSAAALGRGAQLYARFLGLWALSNLCVLVSGAGVLLIARWVVRLLAESPSEMTFYWVVASGVFAGGFLCLFFATVHDHARVRSAATGAGAIRAFGWAFAYVGRREMRALPLAFLLLTSSVLVWGVYQIIAHYISVSSSLGVTLSLVWGETLLLARMFVRVWWFAAESHLQQGSKRTGSWLPVITDRPAA